MPPCRFANPGNRSPWTNTVSKSTKLGASLWLIQKFAPAMQSKRWGRILTIGSVQQVRPHPDMLVYSATKSALERRVPTWPRNWLSTASPSTIWRRGYRHRSKRGSAGRRNIPAASAVPNPPGYLGDPQDCAGMAVLLCSEAGRYMTGQRPVRGWRDGTAVMRRVPHPWVRSAIGGPILAIGNNDPPDQFDCEEISASGTSRVIDCWL